MTLMGQFISGLLPVILAPLLVLLHIWQSKAITASEVRIGVARLAGSNSKREEKRAMHGTVLFMVPCIGSLVAQRRAACILVALMFLWVLVRQLHFRPKRRMKWVNALHYYRGRKTETAQLWMSSEFWYINVATLPYLYMVYIVLGNSMVLPGHNPRVVAAIMVCIAQGAAIIFFGFTNVIPGYRAFRAAQKAVPEKEEFS